MENIKSGVVCVTKFCGSQSAAFSNYLKYMDRDEAVRNEFISTYNLYNEYMSNPLKTTGLFGKGKKEYTTEEVEAVKEIFKTAQDNDSLMWQTVISFDNRWLTQNGLYNPRDDFFDEKTIKEVATDAINKMLVNENLENAIWTAAVHYNTDNIHIHIATVEPLPLRQKKLFTQYEYTKDPNGNYIQDKYGKWIYLKDESIKAKEEKGKVFTRYRKDTIKDEFGHTQKIEEYVGMFKQESIEICKSYIVNQLLERKDYNKKINEIIRDNIVSKKKENELINDPDFRNLFLQIYKKLPRTGNRGLWNYGNNAIASLRGDIDNLTELYLKKHDKEKYEELMELVKKQSYIYRQAYGDSERDYSKTKKDDLFKRLGNQILREMREFDKKIQNGEIEVIEEDIEELLESINQVSQVENDDNPHIIDETTSTQEKIIYAKWSKEFTIARTCAAKKKYGDALVKYYDLHSDGNALATFELANLYWYGRGVEIDKEKAMQYFKYAQTAYEELFPSLPKDDFLRGYLSYRMGTMNLYGCLGDMKIDEAVKWLQISSESGNATASYVLGNLYLYGTGVEKDIPKAMRLFESSGNAYGLYKLGTIYLNGLEDIEADQELANHYFSLTLKAFEIMNKKSSNDNCEYKLGMMYLNGYGTERDEDKAKEFLVSAAERGNPYAQFQVAKIYQKENDLEKMDKTIEYLKLSAKKGDNDRAKKMLAKIYSDEQSGVYNLAKAIEWYKEIKSIDSISAYNLGKIYDKLGKNEEAFGSYKASADMGNSYAMYKIGRLYFERNDYGNGIVYLEQAAQNSFLPACYKLGKLYVDSNLTYYNPQKGIALLEMCAYEGNEYAQVSLGYIYKKGEANFPGVNVDDNLAMKYFKMAAAQGNEVAEREINNMISSNGKSKSSKKRIISPRRQTYELEKALRALKKSMAEENNANQNMREFNRLERKIQNEKQNATYEMDEL